MWNRKEITKGKSVSGFFFPIAVIVAAEIKLRLVLGIIICMNYPSLIFLDLKILLTCNRLH